MALSRFLSFCFPKFQWSVPAHSGLRIFHRDTLSNQICYSQIKLDLCVRDVRILHACCCSGATHNRYFDKEKVIGDGVSARGASPKYTLCTAKGHVVHYKKARVRPL